MPKVFVSRSGFLCTYCNKKRKGAYRMVDGEKSCEKCNREYDYVPPPRQKVKCPVCNGLGYITEK